MADSSGEGDMAAAAADNTLTTEDASRVDPETGDKPNASDQTGEGGSQLPATETNEPGTSTSEETEVFRAVSEAATEKPADTEAAAAGGSAAGLAAAPAQLDVTSSEPTADVNVSPASAEADVETTKTIILTGFGGYNKLQIKQRPRPSAVVGDGEILLHVRATGVNFADLNIRQGAFDPLPGTPAVLGFEASGDVLAAGKDVTEFQAGDRVFCWNNLGLWAEHVLVPANQCFPMPEDMSYDEAAALPINYVAAHQILFEWGNLRPGQSVLIHMAAGGVGMAATQLCKTVPDVIVYGTASAAKHDVIKANGVDHPLNYADYAEEIRKIDPEGVDIVMDPLSGSDSVKGFNLLKPLGKIIHFGVANAVSGPSKSYWSMMKSYMGVKSYSSMDMIAQNKAICGYHLHSLMKKPDLIAGTVQIILGLQRNGKIKPHIDSTWALEDVGLAMARLHERVNIGKVILSPQKEPQPPPAK